jgi:NTP pyrophosphatase (non-canonical NTP hydrolase)
MEISEYQSIIDKTAVYPKHLGPAYTTLGMIGELGEFATAIAKEDIENIKKEGGDVLWYITATCNEFAISVDRVFQIRDHKWPMEHEGKSYANEAILISTEVSELVKKFCRDKTIDLEYLIIKLNHVFTQVLFALSYYGLSLEETLEANYKKLIKRRETNTLHGSGDNREENGI